MKICRLLVCLLLLTAAQGWTAHAQVLSAPASGADKTSSRPPADSYAPIPVVDYAVVKVGVSQLLPGDFLTASDDLQILWVGDEGPDPNYHGPVDAGNYSDVYHVHKWKEGTLTELPTVSSRSGTFTGDAQEYTSSYTKAYYNGVSIFSGCFGFTNSGSEFKTKDASGYSYGQQSVPVKPTFGGNAIWNTIGIDPTYPGLDLSYNVTAANQSGGFVGSGFNEDDHIFFGVDWIGGNFPYAQFNPLFANPPPNSNPLAPSGLALWFDVHSFNDKGWALGFTGPYTIEGDPARYTKVGGALSFWDGTSLTTAPDFSLNTGFVDDMNNQGRAIVTLRQPDGPSYYEPCLLDVANLSAANCQALQGLLAPALQDEVSIFYDIAQSLIISNEKPTDHKYKILCTVASQLPADQRVDESGYGVLTYDPTVDPVTTKPKGWSYARLRLPANVEIFTTAALNPDGCITASGQADTTNPPPTGARDILLLLPVEIVNGKDNLLSDLKVANMATSGVLTGTRNATIGDLDSVTLNPEVDPDRYYVRIRGGTLVGSSGKISVETRENPDPSFDDPGNDLQLSISGNDLVSKSLLLTAGDVDSYHPVDGVTSDALNDRTHRVEVGGKFRVKSLQLGTVQTTVNIDRPVVERKHLQFRITILRLTRGGTPVVDQASVEQDIEDAKERYAQAGIDIGATIRVEDSPSGVDLSDGLTSGLNGNLLPELIALGNGLGNR